jgi:hypothetical protein
MTAVLTQPPPTPSRQGSRVAALVAGGVLALISTLLLGLGLLALWGDSKADEQGYISTPTERYTTTTSAIATEDLDVEDVPGWIVDSDDLGQVRLKVTPRTDKPVFVGIARSEAVADYLRGAAHTTLTDVDYSPFQPSYRDSGGARELGPPASQPIWETSAHGPGTQTVTWDVDNGSWTAVVMNEDGSAGIDTGVRAGTKLSWLAPAGWGALGGALLTLLAAAGLVFLGVRTPRNRTPVPYAPAA